MSAAFALLACAGAASAQRYAYGYPSDHYYGDRYQPRPAPQPYYRYAPRPQPEPQAYRRYAPDPQPYYRAPQAETPPPQPEYGYPPQAEPQPQARYKPEAPAPVSPDYAYIPPPPRAAPYTPDSRAFQSGQRWADIVTQPARDVNAVPTEIPTVLAAALENPYRTDDVQGCEQLAYWVERLDEALGPDPVQAAAHPENRTGRLAEAGGRALVNSIIPFRGLVREVSGAATAQRQLDQAVTAGQTRRGFLRGLQHSRGCVRQPDGRRAALETRR